ncbi:hypothetical protein ACTI_53170 [Actinoplanes sp. OR16]|uniref:sensor histidine kinase n=1 Tax=Actinoplanes sp. OR16 TaxID=946334 RepID=UPI000F6BA206|nr:histidine kinase [Actinoplanes sp. OR16]BBH68632.1 hypothetical protein ACTI_53170 [Actinoplanes sp. OR16]
MTAPERRLVDRPAPMLIAAGTGLAGLAVAGGLLDMRGPTPTPVAIPAMLAVSFAPLGVFVLRRLPGHPLGRLMLLVGVTATVAVVAACWSAWLPLAWLSQWAWWPPLATIPLIMLVIPDGRTPSPRRRVAGAVLVIAGGVATGALAIAALLRPRTLLTVVDDRPPPGLRWLGVVALSMVGVVAVTTLVVVVLLVARLPGLDREQRQQLACLLPSAVLLVAGIALDYGNVPYGGLIAIPALPLGLTFAVLHYRWHDLDLYIHRGLVWLTLTGLAVGVFALTATVVGRTVAAATGWTAAIVAVGAVAAALHPAERAARRAIDRLLYGRRDDPYLILTRTGQHLRAVVDPLDVLPRLLTSLMDGLRVPYAAIALRALSSASEPLVFEQGRRSGEPVRFPMQAHGSVVGDLLVAPRRPGAAFLAGETRLLSVLASQAALAAEACRSTLELQAARERLVFAREEERRRLRRDLHDGVASALTGARLLADAARRALPDGPGPHLLGTLTTELESCATEVRSLIDGLRPAALDDGLRTAVAGLTLRRPGDGPRFAMDTGGDLDHLPAAVEVAAYRIVAEAVTNVVKHAHAEHCRVGLHRDGDRLTVTITDDGAWAGEQAEDRQPVGLISIRSRVEELGGRCDIEPSAAGTRVHVVLPVHT